MQCLRVASEKIVIHLCNFNHNMHLKPMAKPFVLAAATAATAALLTISNKTPSSSRPYRYRRTKGDEQQVLSTLPSDLANNLATVSDPLNLTDTPVFFHIPKAGGTSMKNIYGECLGLVLATGGAARGHEHDQKLQVFSPFKKGNTSVRFVNVDPNSAEGLKHAKELGLAQSGLADVIFSMHFADTVDIFSGPQYQARMFTIMRHPIDRAVSQFYYLQEATWEKTYAPETKGWTVEQYADSKYANHNFVVRQLVNKRHWDAPTDESDLELAKDILQEKFLIGLITNMEESVERFDKYFGFDDVDSKAECIADVLGLGGGKKKGGSSKHGDSNSHAHPKVLPGTSEWNALMDKNYYDMKLYEYAVALFEEQAALFQESEKDES